MSDTTIFLVKMFGPIFLVMGLGILANKGQYEHMMKGLNEFTLAYFIAAVTPLVVGLAIVLNHNMWTTPPEMVISAIGWLAILKGILRCLAPEWTLKVLRGFASGNHLTAASVAMIILGAYLGWIGYMA